MPFLCKIQASNQARNVNFKGALLELCQRHKLATPIFESSGKGPSHDMFFSASVSLDIGAKNYTGEALNAPTKKDAEGIASRELLQQIEPLFKSSKAVSVANATTNPVGCLQEMAQAQKTIPPEYVFEQVDDIFSCTLTTHFGTARTFVGTGTSKKDAKTKVAALALNELNREI